MPTTKQEYIVTEGEVYLFDEKADHLYAHQFGDWVIVAAVNPEQALKKAMIIDDSNLVRHVDRFQKVVNIFQKLLELHQADPDNYFDLTVRQLVEGAKFRSTYVFSR